MRNIIVNDDLSSQIDVDNDDSIVAIENFSVQLQTVILTSKGRLYVLSNEDGIFASALSGNRFIELNVEDIQNNQWFYVSTIIETNSILCISCQGNIVRLSLDQNSQSFDSFVPEVEIEGQVDDGIACAQWNPEKSMLALLSNNNSLLFMTVYMELVLEISIEPRVLNTPAAISWRSDGSCFALSTTDQNDNLSRIRFYSKDGEFINAGRNVAEGVAAIVRGVSSAAVAYAPNNTLVAFPLQKTSTRTQIAFLEPNGLRHGEFDLQMPGNQQYKVSTLHWDIATSILAVGLSMVDNTAASTTQETSSSAPIHMVQLYTRGNYRWYLKQQFSGADMVCLGFDSEVANRLYFTQTLSVNDDKNGSKCTYLRTVDLLLDVCTSAGCSDCSVAVIDGSQVLLTPLGVSAVPPPMSAYKTALSHACNLCSFWKVNGCQCTTCSDQSTGIGQQEEQVATELTKSNVKQAKWGLVCVGDLFSIQLIFGSEKGAPTEAVRVDTDNLILQLEDILNISSTTKYVLHKHNIFCKSVSCSQSKHSLSMNMCLLVHMLGQGTFIICLQVDITNGRVLDLSLLNMSSLYCELNNVSNNCLKCLVSTQDANCQLGALGLSSSSSFEVKFFDMKLANESSDMKSKSKVVQEIEWLGEPVTLPEPCIQLSLITTSSTELDSASLVPTASASAADSSMSLDNEDKPTLHWTVVGLSPKGRLYCGEVMLANGASSYTLNSQLDLLLYITIGTRPQLHYMSISALVGLSSLHGQHTEEQYFLEVGEARPVERGAKLIASVHGEAKVVIQLPRGNLEIFEPRTLILTKVRLLLQQDRLYDSLIMLRRQKVDLNYLFDYDPSILLYNMKPFIEGILNTDPEYLSLFLSSLEPGNASTVKYPIAITGHVNHKMNQADSEVKYKEVLQKEGLTLHELFSPTPVTASSTGSSTSAANPTKTKVNAVCRFVRKELNAILTGTNSNVKSDKVLHPLLCTYARQRPPLLAEALDCISKQFSSEMHVSSNLSSAVGIEDISAKASRLIALLGKKRAAILSSTHVQSALKYLAFLVEGPKLFDAAVSEGDFAMARAVARQCQMDPKIYIPLLERFESILNIGPSSPPTQASAASSVSSSSDSNLSSLVEYRYQLMFFEINFHLNRCMQSIDFAILTLQAKLRLEEAMASASLTGADSVISTTAAATTVIRSDDSLCDCLFKITCEHELYAKTIPALSSILLTAVSHHRNSSSSSHSHSHTTDSEDIKPTSSSLYSKIKSLQNKIRLAYGTNRQGKQMYDEAIAAYLLTDPPSYTEAINAAKLNGNWQQTITLVGRQAMAEKVDAGVGKAKMQKIVSEIVTDFKASLEQGNTEADDATFQSIIPSYILASAQTDLDNQHSVSSGTATASGNIAKASNDNISSLEQDRAIEAAELCVTFLGDVESAIEILLAARHWTRAIELCVRLQRSDLLYQEVAVHVRDASLCLSKLLPAIASKQQTLVNELTNSFWDNPEMRITKLKEIDPDSFKRSTEATGGINDENGKTKGMFDDNQSEYSVASHLSRVSYQSHISVVSGSSQLSRQSTSTSVSVLSNLSFSKASTATSIHAKGDNFSIAGLDHNLLSRGEHSEWEKQNPNNVLLNKGGQIKRQDKHKISEKRQKKHDRKRGQRVLGNDVMNLGREKDICMELWNIAQFHLMTKECTRLCDALLILNGTHVYATGQLTDEILSFLHHTRAVSTTDETSRSSSSPVEISDHVLAMLLQSVTDDMAIALKTHIPPVAPRYPRHFLEKKQMLVVARFQDTTTSTTTATAAGVTVNKDKSLYEDNDGDNEKDNDVIEAEDPNVKPVKSWWQTAADAIVAWESVRKISLTV